MKRTRDQLRAELLAAAEEVIDELLEWHERSEAPTLTEIEDAVLDLRKRLGERMEQAVIEDQEAIHPVPGPACPTCGREMHYKGMKELTVRGRTGDIELERAYFYCDRCRRGLFPPRSTTEAEGETLERRSFEAGRVAERNCGL
jgi:hypothetical protein